MVATLRTHTSPLPVTYWQHLPIYTCTLHSIEFKTFSFHSRENSSMRSLCTRSYSGCRSVCVPSKLHWTSGILEQWELDPLSDPPFICVLEACFCLLGIRANRAMINRNRVGKPLTTDADCEMVIFENLLWQSSFMPLEHRSPVQTWWFKCWSAAKLSYIKCFTTICQL